MKTPMKKTTIQILTALAVVALSTVSVFAAGTDTWVGTTDANWSTAGNWSPSATPANGDSLVFGAAGSSGLTLNNNITGLTINKLTFNSGASSFTFGGNTFTNGAGGIDASALTSGTLTFTPTIFIGNGLQKWNVGAGATLAFGALGAGADAADLYTPNGAMVIISSTGTKTTTTADGWGWRSGAVAGTGPLGPGMVIDNGNNTYDWASVGTQTAGTSHAIVAATYTTAVNGDAHNVKVTANTTVSVNGSWASLLVNGATLTANTGGSLYLDTGMILENGGTINGSDPIKSNANGLYIYVPDSGTISSSLQNNGSNTRLLYKAGPGTLSLTGNNSYSAGTKLYAGTLSVSNASALGSGALTISGGNLDCSSANLTLNNNIAQNWNADFTFAGSQNLNLGSGAVTLGATRQVTVTANTLTVGGTIADGGAGYGLTKVGNGTLKLAGANSYTGATIVNAGILEVTNGTGIAAGSTVTVNLTGTLLVDSGATVGSSTVAVSGGTLSGAGTVSGNTTVSSSGALTPRPSGGSATTLTFSGNLTLSGASANFTLSTSAAGFNDKVNYGSSGTLTLDNSDTINITGTTFDSASDYTLFASTGGTVSLATRPTLKINGVTSDQTSPGSYQLNISGSSVVLHYIQAAVPPTVNSANASPSSLGHYQTTTVTVNVTPASGKSITSVTVGVDGLGGAGDPVTLTGPGGNGAGNWTGTFTVPGTLASGSYAISGTVNQSDGGSAAWSVSGITVTTASPVWSGGGSDNKWSTGGNWNLGHGPGAGDSAAFAGSTQLTNNLDASFGVTSLTFNSGAGSFDITNSSSTLTLTGGLTNNSANGQTLDVPVALNGAQTISVAAGNVAINRPVSDTGGGLTLAGNNTLTLTGTNTFTGAVTVSAGTLEVAGAGQLGGGSYAGNIDDENALRYDSSAAQTLSGTISGAGSLIVSNGNLMLSGANTFSGGVTISNGIVGLGNGAGLGTGALTLAGGTVQNAAGVSLVNDVVVGDGGGTIKLGATSDFWVGSSLSGTGNLILGGASPGVNSLNVGLSANNMSGGSITIPLTGNNQTVVRFKSTTSGNAGVLWSVGGCPDRYVTLDFGDGTIEFGALTGAGILAGNGSGTKTVEVGALNADSTFAGKFLDGSGVLSLNKVGTGTLTLAGGPTAISGGINIYQGLLNVGVANALNSTTTITFGGGMLQYSAANQADYGAHIVNSGSPIAIDLNGTSVTFASPIPNSNAGGLVLTNSTGSGKLTLTANSLYYGDTYVAGGTLALSGSGNISDTGNIIVNSGSRFDVSTANAYTLGSAQTLAGSGTVTGAVTTVNTGSFISPGGTVPGNSYGEWVVGTLTFQNNLIMNGGGSAVFDLSPSHASGNDQIVINGNLKLGTADTIHLNALTSGGNLDETGDYVLFSVTGTLSMGSIPVLVFDNTPPGDAANWWIKASGKNVVLHYSLNPPPFVTSVIVTNTADGSTVVMRGQSVTVFATVQQTVNNLSSVTVDLSPIGGSATQAMALVGGSGGVYEYTYGPVAVGPGAVVGNDTIGVAATDTSSAVGTASTTLIVYATTETWSGLAADGNWSSTANWAGGLAPGYSGDTVIFTGSTGLSPNLEANYEVASLTFDGSADIFTIGSTSGKSLALDGMLNNSSANLQTISAPVVLNTGASINDNGSGLALSGTVSGASLAVSAGTVILAGANTYSGDTTIAAGATLLAGNTHAIPSGAGKGNVDVASSATLDVHGTNVSVNGLTDAGTVDNLGADPATLTVGNGNASSTFTGMIVNSLGAVSLVKTGSGTFTIGKNNLYAGGTTIQGGSVVLPNGADNAFGTGSLTLSNGTLVVQAGGGGSWNSGNACYLGNNLIIAPGSTNVIDDSVNNYGNLWVAGDNVNWTGTGTLKFQNNGGVNQPGLIWNGNPLATFNGTIILGSAANNNSFVFNGLAYSGSASGGTGAAVTTFDASGTAWNLGDIGYSVTQVADSGCTNIKMGSISGSNTNTVLKGNPSSSVNTTFEVGALGASTTFAGKITDWGAGGTCLTKVGSGSLTLLSTANSYTGPTTVSSGTLLVNGAIASPVTVNGGTFGGTGTVNNSVTVNSGGTLSPGASIGTLTISGNLSLSGNTLVELNQSLSPAQSNDFVNVTGTLTYGGTLTVNNLGPALAAGNHFRLFPPGGANAGGMTVVGSAGSGLAYSFNDGVLSVTSAAGSSAVITNSVSGGNLNLAWPSGQGWTLQSQTNSLSTGLSPTGWSAVSGAADGSYSIMINTTNPAVFYRLGK
jgi:autotransporter-associated beta strand protein